MSFLAWALPSPAAAASWAHLALLVGFGYGLWRVLHLAQDRWGA